MKIEEKRVTFPKTLSVKYAGKIVEETATHLTLEGENEDSYLKIFTPFRGVAKLLLFENDKWVDAENSSAVSNFDFSSLGLGDLSTLSAGDEADSSGTKKTLVDELIKSKKLRKKYLNTESQRQT